MIGRTVSHYEIVAKLGEGGMGEVYLARDTQLERKVALKVLSTDLLEDPERLRRLKREARSLAALDHPNIVPVHSFESADGLDFLTMAFIDGRPLDELIPESGFEASELLDIAVPLADALRAAHQQGIVHRDLKPANVMIDREGRPRVLDFGLAKREPTLGANLGQGSTLGPSELMTRAGMIVGTFPYMSPEQAEGREVDARSDLFSFGVMLYEMACGKRPFQGDTAISLISSILRDSQRPMREVKPALPSRLDAILARCLEKEPDRRYSSAAALKADLEALRQQVAHGRALPPVADGPTIVLPAEPATHLAVRVRRRSAFWLAAAVAVAAVGVGTWKLWPSSRATRVLAVLPFENTSGDSENDYLCDGVAESLIGQTSKLPTIRVRPLSAALDARKRKLAPREAGRQLGADLVLAGALNRKEERLKITAELLDVDSGARLWSRSYDREATKLLDLETEIAGAILDTGLRVELSTEQRRELIRSPTTSGEAYDLYLQARHLQRRGTEDDYLEARELLQRGVARDPQFAQAYLMLAGIHAAMAIDGYLRPTDGWAQANRYLRQALALDPALPDAPAIRHGMACFFDWDWGGAARERELMMHSPIGAFDPDLLRTYSFELIALGRTQEALEMARRARELDPLSTGLAMLEADYLVRAGQLDAAVALYQRTIQVEPDNPEQYFGLAEALVEKGRFDLAIEARRKAHEVAGDEEMTKVFAVAHGEGGYRQADRAWIGAQLLMLEARATWGYVSPLDFARAHAQLGHKEKAFEFIEKAFADRAPGLVFLNSDRAWDSIRDDPRFASAVARVGLPPRT